MSQSNILKLLKKKRKWMTSKGISEILKISCANNALRKLFRYGEILRRENRISGEHLVYQYKIK